MRARSRPSISPRQSPSSAILWSINSEGDFPDALLLMISVFVAESWHTSVCPRQDLLQVGEEILPSAPGATIGQLLIRPEARLLHAQLSSRARRGERPGHDALEIEGRPCIGQRLVRLDDQDLTIDDDVHVRFGGPAQIEAMTHERVEIVLHEPLLDQMWLRERAPDLLRRMGQLTFDNDGARFGLVHWSITSAPAQMVDVGARRSSSGMPYQRASCVI